MFIKQKFRKKEGFILYESVIALMVTLMTLGILHQSLQIMKAIQNTSSKDQLRWHITQEKLQETLGDAHLRRVTTDKIIYDKPGNKGINVIESYGPSANSMLRMRTATSGGHEPIITNLNRIYIEKSQNLVIITTVNKANETSEMYLTNGS